MNTQTQTAPVKLDLESVKRWLEKISGGGPKVAGCEVFMSIFTANYAAEPHCVYEFGLAVLLDKPVYLLCNTGQEIPDNVKRLARHIEYFDKDAPGAFEKASDNLKAIFMRDHGDAT